MSIVTGSLVALALAAASKPIPATSAPATPAPGVTLLRGEFVPGRQPDGNTIVLDAPKGLIVFDTGRHAGHAQAVLDLAKSRGKPIVAIVNSHWHLDHVGGNVKLRAAFPQAKVYATGAIDAALGGFLASYRRQLSQAIDLAASDPKAQDGYRAELALIDAGERLQPTERIARSGVRDIAGRRVEINVVAPAVTGGDLWLFDAATRTLLAGDLVTLPAPLFDTACPARWSAALAALDQSDFRQLVPGHGAPMRHEELSQYRRAFDGLVACAASPRAAAECTSGWIDDAGTLIPEAERTFARTLVDYYVGNVLRGDAARLEANCATSNDLH